MAENDDGLRVRRPDEEQDTPERWTDKARRWTRDLLITVVGFAALWIGLGVLRAPDLPDVAPPLTGTTLAGTSVDLAAHGGRVAVVNFWATWCSPCAIEMPELVSFSENNPDIPVLFVAVDGKPEQLRAYAIAHSLPLDQVVIPTADFKTRWPVSTLPTTVVVGEGGRIVGAHAGIVLPPQLWWWTH